MQSLLLEAQNGKNEVTIALTGDIMMGTTYPSVQLPTREGRQLFIHAEPVLKRADLAAGNLEGTLCDSGSTRKKPGKASFAFRTPTSYVERLKEAGYDFLSLANNHSYDFGQIGVHSTVNSLRTQGIAFAGIKEYPASVIVERNGVRYGLCAFGHNAYTYRHQDLESVRRIITDLVNSSDVVIVSFHGGAEGVAHTRLPYGKETFYSEDRGSLRDFAHFCIDAGADVVFGHGPHVLRAVELYKEHFIAYSLGNFCTPFGMSLSGVLSYAPILELTLTTDGRFRSGQIHSFIQRRGEGPQPDFQHRCAKEMRRLTQLDVPDTPLIITDFGLIKHK